jgi:hypothetical protein
MGIPQRALPDGRVLMVIPLTFGRARLQLFARGELTTIDEW